MKGFPVQTKITGVCTTPLVAILHPDAPVQIIVDVVVPDDVVVRVEDPDPAIVITATAIAVDVVVLDEGVR